MNAHLGRLFESPLGSLRLDVENPRIPDQLRSDDQVELAVLLEMGFEAFAVAQSIADNGYFASEPLLVIDAGEGIWTVVEGNRRLTALMGLAFPEVRSEFADPSRWEAIAGSAGIDGGTHIPVVVHADRSSTHVEVAKAHVIGKLAWRPYMQARFIAARVSEGKTFVEVAELLGVTKSKVADLYRDQAVVQQAQRLGLETSEIEKAFSVLTVAMSNTKLRDHIGAPLASRLVPGEDPIPEERADNLRELVGWVFGDETQEPVISDSRQISKLGNIVAHDVGVAELRRGASLEAAKQKVETAGVDPRDRLISRLRTGRNALQAASEDMTEHAADGDVQALLFDVEAVVESLRSMSDELELEAEDG